MQKMDTLVPVIISGGAGTRLWPLSRQSFPKPFIRLADGHSLLQHTLKRAVLLGAKHIISVTNQDYYLQTKEEMATLLGSDIMIHYLLEPVSRNTASAIGLASIYAKEKFSEDTRLLILPADHVINDYLHFMEDVLVATTVADDCIATFGIASTSPDINFGYIECGEKDKTFENVFHIKKFIEKPNEEKATLYYQDKNFVWNAGIFCFKPDVFLQELNQHDPLLYQGLLKCFGPEKISPVYFKQEQFEKLHSVSVDYAVMEKTKNIRVVKAKFDWSDVGSLSVLNPLVLEENATNHSAGECLLFESENCNIHSYTRLVVTIGVEGLTIVDTADALLIADNNHLHKMPAVVNQLMSEKHKAYFSNRTTCRPWGTYTILEEGEGFKIKRIVVKPGGKLSLQMHLHRNEHWVVVSGTATIIVGEEEKLIHTNQSSYISAGIPHRLMNTGKIDLVLIEVQTGEYLGEDDIVRFDDTYGRTKQLSEY